MRNAVIGGVVGGALGALIWAMISYHAGVEIGWIAWGVGGLVGFTVRVGAGDEEGTAYGLLAVAIAVAALVGGKWVAVDLSVDAEKDRAIAAHRAVAADEETALFDIGLHLALDAEMAVAATAERLDELPLEVRHAALEIWDAMDLDAQNEYLARLSAEHEAQVEVIAAAWRSEAFTSSFGLLDLIFFGLAVVTAFGLGANRTAWGED